MSKKQRFFNFALIFAMLACGTTLFVANAVGQKSENTTGSNVRVVLFKEADTAMQAAKEAQAEVLAPKNFGEAMKRYQEAHADLNKGNNLEDIQKKLRESCDYFQKAIDATKMAEVTFPNSMKARKDAHRTESAKFSSKLWTEAEKKFNEAVRELEEGDLNNAREKAGEAEELYRKAELDAIKINYLDETYALLKQADQLKVKDHAPKTLLNAQQLVKQAEKELNENRYDTDVARSLAQQANYQAKHAIYLASAIKQMKDQDQSWEDLMLASEKPLQKIAEKADLIASFDAGFGKTTDEIIEYITTSQTSVARLNQDLNWRKQELTLQQARVAEMEQQLGSQVKEQSSLAQQITNQAKTRELFANMERSFSAEEARVLREGNDIIIRLVGLNFPVAQSTVEQKSFGLLTKVRDAINSFPNSTVSVLGNTDSYGSDETNLQLSTDRAEAVKQYLLANSKLVTSQIEVIGYGESKPIASNETTAGRAANRRVEVVIHPGPMEEVVLLTK
jgi:outer membrane protein OmpA-like peptidoglycan-associated protein/HEPN domain-containing protein